MPAHIVAPNDSPNNRIDPTTGEIIPVAPYQLLPLLDDTRYQQLKADIAARGVLVPVEYDADGNILDGHHRVRAWRELTDEGVRMPDYPRVVRQFTDESAKRLHVRALLVFLFYAVLWAAIIGVAVVLTATLLGEVLP